MGKRFFLCNFAFVMTMFIAHSGVAFAESPRLVIIDDDGFALAQWMVLKAPDVKVLGVATVTGGVWQKEATVRALRGLEIANRTDVPVVGGATYPLLNSEKLTDRWESLYGHLTWRGAWMRRWVEPTSQPLRPYHGPDIVPNLPNGPPHIKASPEQAANFMIRMVHQYPGQVSIIETGPMTNLALAQRLDPDFAGLAKELVYMGGSLAPHRKLTSESSQQFEREFVNSPRREFNIRFDPEAASIVMRAPWKKIVMVPVDPSTETEMSPALLQRLTATNTPIAHQLGGRKAAFPLWDEIAVAVWLDPSLIKSSINLYVDVNTQFSAGYGDILSWNAGYQPDLDEQREEVVLSVDVPRMEALLVQLVGSP
ncbi:MAG: nucleoside hydrolase [Acetobacter aceti]